MIGEEIREMLAREPFRPFRIIMSSGEKYVIDNPGSAMALKSELFVAMDDGERVRICPYLHVTTIEYVNGRASRLRRRKRRR
ncbi:MAG TPA: hypothetical protein VJZ71_01290 [Phycisphaerae bacterium]|nr:hypothetical protein [Phycisphaerae bacterium]